MDNLEITIGFSTTTKRISRLIRWFTGSKVSHAWTAFHDYSLQTRMVMQAEAWGFELRPWERWQKENVLVAEFKPTGPSLTSSLRKLAGELGTKYDFRSATLLGAMRLWLGNSVKGKFNTPHQLMCSESVIRLLADAGYSLVEGLDPETTSPGELLELFLDKPDEFDTIVLAKPLQK